MTDILSPTLFPRSIIIFQGVLTKFNFLTKFPHLGKFPDFMKDLKYEHQSNFLSGEGSNLILGTGTKNQTFVYRMGRLCGGAHEISGIKAPLFLQGWVVGGFLGGVGGGGVGRDGWVSGGGGVGGDGVWVVGWLGWGWCWGGWGVWCAGEWWGGWCWEGEF